MMVVVITGGIGSGKSLVCRILNEEFGWPVYNADSRVKQLYDSKLAQRIFSDNEALLQVESLVFPCLTLDFNEWKQMNSQSEYQVLESATILEKPQLRTMGDIFLLINAPINVRANRVMTRDGMSADKVTARLASQPLMNLYSEIGNVTGVDYSICNDSSVEDLRKSVADFVRRIR